MPINLGLTEPNQTTQEDDLRARRFSLPQFKTSSPLMNNANSQVMQSPANDPFSGAKTGMAKQASIPTSLPAPGIPVDTPSSPTGEKENTAPDPSRPHTLAPVMEAEYQKTSRATDPSVYQQSLDEVRNLSRVAAGLHEQESKFVPEQQPVSRGRRIGAIATGLLTGVLTKSPEAATQSYRDIAYSPAYREQRQMGIRSAAADKALKDATDIAQRDIEGVKTQATAGGIRSGLLKGQEEALEYGQTGAAEQQAKAESDRATASKAPSEIKKAEADTEEAHARAMAIGEPKVTNLSELGVALETKLDKKTGQWTTERIPLSNNGVRLLDPKTEATVKGYVGNDTLKAYYSGDDAAAKAVNGAIEKHIIATNPITVYGAPGTVQQIEEKDGTKHVYQIDNRGHASEIKLPGSDKTMTDMSKKGEHLNQTSVAQYKGAINTAKTAPHILQLIDAAKDKLGPLQGRVSNFMTEDVGRYGPDVAALKTALKSYAPFVAAMHTGRTSASLLKEFEDAIGKVHMDPENLKRKINELIYNANTAIETTEQMNPNAVEVQAQREAGGPKVGDIVTVGGVKHKITAIHADGTWDGEEVK